MKKFITGFVCAAVLFTSTTALAETSSTIEAVFDRIKLVVDGENVDKETLLYNGVTYVPLRAAAEVLGMDVNYDEGSQTAYLISPVPAAPEATPAPTPTPTPAPTPAPTPSEVVEEKAKITRAIDLMQAFVDEKLPVTEAKEVRVNDNKGGVGNYVEKIVFKDARYGTAQTSRGVITPEFQISIFKDKQTLMRALGDYVDRQDIYNVNEMFYHYYYYDNVLLLIPETVKFDSVLEYERIFDEIVK